MKKEELIEINKPDTVANNFLFDLVQDLRNYKFSSSKWFAWTNEKHDFLKISTYLNHQEADLKMFKNIMIELKKYYDFTYLLEIINPVENGIKIEVSKMRYREKVEVIPEIIPKEKEKEYLNISREELISICEDSIVGFEDWDNRDSYSAQVLVSDIFSLLNTGASYRIHQEQETLWIEFLNVTTEQASNMNKYYLDYDSLEDFRNKYPDYEMFDGYGLEIYRYSTQDELDDTYIGGYLPTRARLDKVDGADWY